MLTSWVPLLNARPTYPFSRIPWVEILEVLPASLASAISWLRRAKQSRFDRGFSEFVISIDNYFRLRGLFIALCNRCNLSLLVVLPTTNMLLAKEYHRENSRWRWNKLTGFYMC